MIGNLVLVGVMVLWMTAVARGADDGLGIFEGQTDVGTVTGGAGKYDPATRTFTVTAAGKNVWAKEDAFHFVWKKVAAGTDLSLSATIEFDPADGAADPHRKAFVMIRQSLDADASYADACVHGNGLTAIQYRHEKGGLTFETQAQANAPRRVRIEKRGDVFSMSFGTSDTGMKPAGGACKVAMTGAFYVGIGVCSHHEGHAETARFTDVVIAPVSGSANGKTRMLSTVETLGIASRDRRTVCIIEHPGLARAEAPNWGPDGLLYFNSAGRMYKVKADVPDGKPPTAPAQQPQLVDLGILTNINNDHLIAPDGKSLAVSDQSQDDRRSAIWVVPINGGEPRRVTEKTPSYLHGWSPDGKTLAFCGQRAGQFDIYTIPASGGEETRLTTTPGKDDGPEYSPDGQWIYFNSDRTGSMQIWRMKSDGSAQEQVTGDERNNWFPHLSPDGKSMVYIAYEKGVTDHPENKDVELRLMKLETREVSTLARVFGGQGTMNVPSWSPDGKCLAFVSYQVVPE